MSSVNFLKINVLKGERELLKLRLEETLVNSFSKYRDDCDIVFKFLDERIEELKREQDVD